MGCRDWRGGGSPPGSIRLVEEGGREAEAPGADPGLPLLHCPCGAARVTSCIPALRTKGLVDGDQIQRPTGRGRLSRYELLFVFF